MCNLSQGILERGYKERDKDKIAEMLKRGKSVKDIAEFCGYPVELVESVEKEVFAAS